MSFSPNNNVQVICHLHLRLGFVSVHCTWLCCEPWWDLRDVQEQYWISTKECNAEIVSSFCYDGWDVKNLKWHGWKAKGDKLLDSWSSWKVVDAESSISFVFFYIWLFCWLADYVFLMFCFHRNNVIDLNLVMEWVPCYLCNGYLMEMHITLHEDGWLGVSTPLTWHAPWSRGEPTWRFPNVKLRKVGTEGHTPDFQL